MTKIINIGKSIIDIIIGTFIELIATAIRFFPGPIGNIVRYQFYKRRLKSIGKGVIIDVGVYILVNPKYISIGDNTWIDKNVILTAGKPTKGERLFIEKKNRSYKGKRGELKIGKGCHIAKYAMIQAHGGVEIADYCGLADGAKIYSMSDHYRNLNDPQDSTVYKYSPMAPAKEQCLIIGPVVMEKNTGLAVNSVILSGVTIGENSWVGVNSLVIKDIPPDSIAIGIPAKVIKKRFE